MSLLPFSYRLSVPQLAFFVAVYIVTVNNRFFWNHFLGAVNIGQIHEFVFALACLLAIIALFTLVFLLLSQKHIFKPVLILMLMVSAVVSYFQTDYGVIINKEMIQNVFETDYHEAMELINRHMLLDIAGYGILPALLVGVAKINYQSLKKELLLRGVCGLGLVTIILLTVWGNYKDFSLTLRSHPELRYMLNPSYAINSLYKYAVMVNKANQPLTLIAKDAVRTPALKPRLMVLVVGETARADNFSLNGYSRLTNPLLAQEPITFFSHVTSCGTATAQSLPCIFSHLGQADYTVDKAGLYSNILDVLAKTGVSVLWRDNNSGCKGVCERVETQLLWLNKYKDAKFCVGDECYDEQLLSNLPELIAKQSGDLLIVLHQKGSHGPAYYLRHPQNFGQFQPECLDSAPQNCAQQTIINAYDNTILYTDYFLHQTIKLLKTITSHDALLLYVSDHGESLGENGFYLHGLPYAVAPEQQTHIPMISWLSDGFLASRKTDRQCLQQNKERAYSHDNIFHSLLGVFNIQTKIYQQQLDIFFSCQANNSSLN